METPAADDLPATIDLVGSWQTEGQLVQVHLGDLGWYQRFGAEALASALRLWSLGGAAMAVGFLDESELIRIAVSPACGDDATLAEVGWTPDAPWTTLHRELSAAVAAYRAAGMDILGEFTDFVRP